MQKGKTFLAVRSGMQPLAIAAMILVSWLLGFQSAHALVAAPVINNKTETGAAAGVCTHKSFDFELTFSNFGISTTFNIINATDEIISNTANAGEIANDDIVSRQFNLTLNSAPTSTNLFILITFASAVSPVKVPFTCTPLSNGSITIKESSIGGDGAYQFIVTTAVSVGIGGFSLNTIGGSAAHTLNQLAADTYLITVDPVDGRTVTGIVCNSVNSSTDTDISTALVVLAEGEHVTCEFTHEPAVATGPGSITIAAVATGGDGTFAFASSSVSLPGFSLVTHAGAALKSASGLPAGLYSIAEVVPDGWALTAISCSSGDGVLTDLAAGSVTISLLPDLDVKCTFSNTEIAGKTASEIQNFQDQTANLISSNAPPAWYLSQRLAGGNGGSGSGGPMALGGPAVSSPVVSGSGNPGNGSLRIATGAANQKAFNLWGTGELGYHSDALGNGHFGLLTAGLDYLVSPGFLIGIMAEHDTIDQHSAVIGYSINGQGWLAGPYAAVKLGEHLVLDGRVLGGRSETDISPFLTFTDRYSSERMLAAARLIGEWRTGAFVFQPSLEVLHYRETSSAYVDSLGVTIDSVATGIDRAVFGPEFSYQFDLGGGVTLTPRAGVHGIWNFGARDLVAIGTASATLDRFEAKIETGMLFKSDWGGTLDLSGKFEGLGSGEDRIVSGKVTVVLPLN